MIDYNKINEHEFAMIVNAGGFEKFTKAFFDSQFGLSTAFTDRDTFPIFTDSPNSSM